MQQAPGIFEICFGKLENKLQLISGEQENRYLFGGPISLKKLRQTAQVNEQK